MRINFIGNYQSGYVGEIADETHLANELEYLGHEVKRIPRDIWKAYVDGQNNWPEITNNIQADISIICKWPHFSSNNYIQVLKHFSKAPVFYWVWDYMWDQGVPEWHLQMAKAADLYLSNEAGVFTKYYDGANCYYFPFDVADISIDRIESAVNKKYDVSFFGSFLGQGDRISWLEQINKEIPVKIFSWNWEEWKKRGYDAEGPVYGVNFATKVAESKIVLGFNVNDHCWGYWSNRVGKVLAVGGFLLYRYVPGMELFLRDGADYFSSPEEAIRKIKYYLNHGPARKMIAERGYQIGRDRFTSRARVKELIILIERYLNGGLQHFGEFAYLNNI